MHHLKALVNFHHQPPTATLHHQTLGNFRLQRVELHLRTQAILELSQTTLHQITHRPTLDDFQLHQTTPKPPQTHLQTILEHSLILANQLNRHQILDNFHLQPTPHPIQKQSILGDSLIPLPQLHHQISHNFHLQPRTQTTLVISVVI